MLRLELLPVVLNEIKLLSMTVAGIEVVLLHLSVDLVKVPVIVIETIYGAHDAGAMPSTRAVHVKLTSGWIISNLQKRAYLFRGWICFVNNGNVHVAHSSTLNGRLFAVSGIVSQINDSFDTKCRKVSKVLGFWPGAAIKVLVHLAKVVDFDIGETAVLSLGESQTGKGKNKCQCCNNGSGRLSNKFHFKTPQVNRHRLITIGRLGPLIEKHYKGGIDFPDFRGNQKAT